MKKRNNQPPQNWQQPYQQPPQGWQQPPQNWQQPYQQPPKKKKGCFNAVGLFCIIILSAILVPSCFGYSSRSSRQATSEAEDTAPTTEANSQQELPEESAEHLSITLSAGQENEYSETITLNAETDMPVTRLVYFLPAGEYEASNPTDTRAQINVYSRETHDVDGWEEPVDGDAQLIEPETTAPLTIPEDHYIYIADNTTLELTQISANTSENPVTDDSAADKPEHRAGNDFIGVSDKAIADLSATFYDTVRNDKTGGWKCLVIAANVDITEYALSIYNTYYNGAELLIVENLTTKECAVISDMGDMGLIDISTHQYVDGEEHDANIMASGAVTGDFWVYKDNGDIQVIE